MSTYFLILYVYGPSLALAITAAVVFGALSWLLEYFVGRAVGVYAGYLALLAVCAFAAKLSYDYAAECKGLFGRPVLLAPCEWSIVTKSMIVALIAIAVPLLTLSQIKLSRWSRRRALPTH